VVLNTEIVSCIGLLTQELPDFIYKGKERLFITHSVLYFE